MKSKLLKTALQITKNNLKIETGDISAFKTSNGVCYMLRKETNGNSFSKIKEKKSSVINDFKNSSNQSINLI